MPKFTLQNEPEDGVQVAVAYSSTPFLVQAGDPACGVSISASQLNHLGTHTFGEMLPEDAVWVVLQEEAAR